MIGYCLRSQNVLKENLERKKNQCHLSLLNLNSNVLASIGHCRTCNGTFYVPLIFLDPVKQKKELDLKAHRKFSKEKKELLYSCVYHHQRSIFQALKYGKLCRYFKYSTILSHHDT